MTIVAGGPPELRGIFGDNGDSANWLDEMTKFPNGVPRFESGDTCLEFMEWYAINFGGSNPDYPHLMHIFTTLISWDQVEHILLPNILKARKEPSDAKKIPLNYLEDPDPTSSNVYEQPDAQDVIDEILFRLELPIHRCTTPVSTMNTLKYLFFHMKCGIYVMIRNNKLRIFAPFVNGDYRNTWGDALKVEGDGSLDTYYSKKAGQYREEQIEKDRTKWWANGNIICNELTKETDKDQMQYWGDHFMAALRDMLGEVCNQREMPDCEFFLNKRDYPQLKINVKKGGIPVEPYGFIFDKDDRDPDQDVDLVNEHKFSSYAPIVSFYAAPPDRFSDLPWPSSEDWESACGLVFPQTLIHKKKSDGSVEFNGKPRDLFTEANFRKFERGWDDGRVSTAFFRGTATGGGTTIQNNQRLKAAYLCNQWKNDPEKGGDEPFLDAQIVGWNLRDKKIADSPMTFLRSSEFNFTAGRHHFTPIYEQSKYKYLVYIDGHCAACRYGFMMRLGSVILKVAPRQVADRMWYFPLLKPYHDHVPVKDDLSDLEDQIRWCRANDAKCKEIGQNALKFYEKYVARGPLLDYVQMVCRSIAKCYVEPPRWWEAPPKEQPPPKLRKPDHLCYQDNYSGTGRHCIRCKLDEEEEKQSIVAEEAKAEAKKADKMSIKAKLRNRLVKCAKVAK
jgi:Glycosyl transferase family 90